MSLKTLIEFIGKQNIAAEVDKETLDKLSEQVTKHFEEDHESMKDWIEGIDKGIELMKPEFTTKSTPWQGASNYKDPMLTKASIAFGDKASLELLRSPKLVKAEIIGKDKEGQKKAVAERVTEAMNFQFNHQMKDWRADQKRLLYTMPNVGAMFKKTVFNPLEGKAESHTIQYPNFAVNQATTSMEKARSFTQIHEFSKNKVIERQRAGIWLDDEKIMESLYPEDAEGDKGSNEDAEVQDPAENPDRFLEQQCFADLDDDGYEEPYIVTIHERSKTIVRIVARFDEHSLMVKTPVGRITNLIKASRDQQRLLLEAQKAAIDARREPKALPESADLSEFKLIRIEPFQQITKYGFLPSHDGTFLDQGYSHLLGAIVQAMNAFTNQVTDAGTLANNGGGFKAKGFRKKAGPTKMKIGEYLQTNMAARDLQNSLLPNPSPEPSLVLFQMLERLDLKANELAGVVDASGQIQANTAPTTALAIINEALISTSALMGRVIDSESNEFQILFRINKRTFDPELYKIILDEPEANSEQDFNNEGFDISPTASPEMASKTQRIQLSVVELEQIPNVIQAGGNPTPIVKTFFERIGSTNIDDIFPEEPNPTEVAEIKRFTEAQEQENQIQLAQLELTKLQTDVLMREQDRLDADTNRKIKETASKMRVDLSTVVLNLEKAESEDVKNRVSVYTAQVSAAIDSLTAIGAENDRAINSRNKSTP